MSFAQRLLPLQQSQRGAAACRHPAQAVSHALVAVSEHFRRHRRAHTLDQLPQFIQSAGCRLLADPIRHPGPHILNEAEVWAVCWPALQQAAWSLASHSLRVVCPVHSSAVLLEHPAVLVQRAAKQLFASIQQFWRKGLRKAPPAAGPSAELRHLEEARITAYKCVKISARVHDEFGRQDHGASSVLSQGCAQIDCKFRRCTRATGLQWACGSGNPYIMMSKDCVRSAQPCLDAQTRWCCSKLRLCTPASDTSLTAHRAASCRILEVYARRLCDSDACTQPAGGRNECFALAVCVTRPADAVQGRTR